MELLIPMLLVVGLPVIFTFALKTNAGVMFLAAASGLVILSSLDGSVISTAGAVVPGEGEAYVRLAVVTLSMLFGGLVFKHTVGGSTRILHVFLALLLGIVLVLLLPAATGVTWLVNSVDQPYWQDVNNYRSLIIAASFSLSLILILPNANKHKKKSKH